jgi:small subunit ribosomal protein S6
MTDFLLSPLPRVARTAGSLVLRHNGVIRGLTNWGTFHLPMPARTARKGGTRHHAGHYFVLRFDASARAQHELRRTFGLEPRLLRFSVVRMGGKLGEVVGVGGEAEEWAAKEGARGERWDEQ